MPHLPAAVLILIDRPHPDKQWVLAFAAAAAEQLRVLTLCRTWQAAVRLLLSHHIAAVVCALDPGEEARIGIEAAGGWLVVSRDYEVRHRRDVDQLAVRMHKRGIDTQEISQILQVKSADVRSSLWRAGIRSRRSAK